MPSFADRRAPRRRARPGRHASATTGLTCCALAALAAWHAVAHVTQVFDLADPRADGRLVVAANARLGLFRPPGAVRLFSARYSPPGSEAYIARSPGQAVRAARCRFPREAVYALALDAKPGVVVETRGLLRQRVDLPGSGLPNGIAFDTTGRFGHRLLVTRAYAGRTTLIAVDCRGRARTITTSAPAAEGGIAVAPATFGRFAGDLVAPDELSGRMIAIGPDGRSSTIAESGLPTGRDIGVESAGFVPRGFGAGWSAYLADRATPGNPHPGNDAILAVTGGALAGAGVKPGDLLVATEGGAQTIAIRCRASCSVRHVADGPPTAHAEGHIVFRRAAGR